MLGQVRCGNAMRQIVERAYPGDKWKRRVRKMSNSQVYAVYKRLEEQQPWRIQKPYKPKVETFVVEDLYSTIDLSGAAFIPADAVDDCLEEIKSEEDKYWAAYLWGKWPAKEV